MKLAENMRTKVKTEDEIKAMRVSGQILATVLSKLRKSIEPGMTTKDLSEIAKHELKGTGGLPAFLGYPGLPEATDFPDVICISLNDEVVHGIPSSRSTIKSGDIVSMDFGVNYDGMITDSATSVVAGSANPKVDELLETTKKSLYAGIGTLKDGVKVGDIGNAVQTVLEKGKFGIVKDLVGHGVGHELHERPDIPNHGRKGSGPELSAGMTVAIEPMATLGDFKVYIDTDGWTVRTNDHSLSAHFEHTILITEKGHEILTELK